MKTEEKQAIIEKLKELSKEFLDNKQYQDAGRINLAIDVIEDNLTPLPHTELTLN